MIKKDKCQLSLDFSKHINIWLICNIKLKIKNIYGKEKLLGRARSL